MHRDVAILLFFLKTVLQIPQPSAFSLLWEFAHGLW